QLGSGGLAHYIADAIENDDRVIDGGEALGPTHPVEDEQVDPLALRLRAAEREKHIRVCFRLGAETDDHLAGPPGVDEASQDVGILDEAQLERVALLFLLDLRGLDALGPV